MESLPAFVGNLIIVLITAALIPMVFRFIDDRKAARQREEDDYRQRKQKLFDAELSRQAKVIEAQVQFLEQLAELLWKYQLTAIAVSYYHQFDLGAQYQAAAKQYLDEAGTLLGAIRTEISKSLRLCSEPAYNKLLHLYYNRILDLDKDLTALIAAPNQVTVGRRSWGEFNKDAVFQLSKEVDSIIRDLAAEFRLTGEAAFTDDSLAAPAPTATQPILGDDSMRSDSVRTHSQDKSVQQLTEEPKRS
jgi:hypothetical protein